METCLQESINFDQLPIVVWSLDVYVEGPKIRLGQVHYINQTVTNLTGWTLDEIDADPDWWIHHIHRDDVEQVIATTKSLFKTPSVQFDYRFQTKTGDYLWCQDHAYVVERTGNQFKIFGVSKEVSDYKLLEHEHQAISGLFKDVTDAMPVGMLVFQDKILHANPMVEEICGFSQHELEGMAIWELINPELQPLFKKLADQRLQGWQPARHYTHIPGLLKNHQSKQLEIHVSSIDLNGEPAGMVVLLDKSDSHKLQRSLRLQSEILANTYDAIFVFKRESRQVIYANKLAHQSLGYDEGELIGQSLEEMVHPLSWKNRPPCFDELVENKVPCSLELEQVHKNGQVHTVEANMVSHSWNGLDVVVCVARDISQRKEHEAKLQFSNELYDLHAAINHLITKVDNREELCRKLSQTIIDHSSIDAVWTGYVDWEEGVLHTKHIAGAVNAEFMGQDLPLLMEHDEFNGEHAPASIVAALENRTVYHSFDDALMTQVSQAPLTCTVAIPLRQKGLVVGVLNLYSKQTRFDSEHEKSLHQNLVQDVNFILDRFDEQMESQLFFESAKQSPNWMMICDHKGRIEFVNDSVAKTSGYSKEELIGQSPAILKSGHHDEDFYQHFWQTIRAGKPFNGLFTNKNKNNELFLLDETIMPIKHCQGFKYVSVGKDLSKEVALQKELSFLTYNDPITGLPNRAAFMQELESRIIEASLKSDLFMLVVVDVHNFAMLNDTYGFEAGNTLLKKVGKRFNKRVGKHGTVCRFGSDEFAMIITGIDELESGYALVDTLFSSFKKAIKLPGHKEKIQINADFGVVTYPNGGKTADELVHHADLALVNAKKESASSICYYQDGMNEAAQAFLMKHNALNKAVKRQEFVMHYQPYFETRTDEFAGFETLIRWRKGDQIIYPNEFIDELESSGQILKVEDFIMETVFLHVEEWTRQYGVSQRAAINLSAVNLKHQNVLERVKAMMDKTRVNPENITFEIVEGALVEDTDYAQTLFRQLRELGFKIAIDDFGTGYSSFGYLIDLPADFLKIDMSFVQRIKSDDKALAVVESIITMAHSLDMKTIAEGVEDIETFRLLKLMGCDNIQGYYKARPMACENFHEFLSQQVA